MSVDPAGMPWSAEQREWLQALGHDVLMLVPAGATSAPEPVADRAAGVVTTNTAKPHAPAKPASSASPLLHALARAAGRSEQDADFLRALPDIATLRGNPAARRELWPRLRALRKQAKP